MKILTIDGGGIKGLYSAAFIAGLEKRFNKQIADCFDLIAGTSTGGILALALAAKIPAKDIVKFYKDWGPKIFPQRFTKYYMIKSLLFSKYANTVLEEALRHVFGKLKIKDVYSSENPTALCIPSINAVTGEPYVFKTPHDSKLIRDLDCYLWEVGLATSAAPTYLPLAKIALADSTSSNLFVDGGLWANNPSKVALVEGLTYIESDINNIELLSIGNIKSMTAFNSSTILERGLLLWRENIISLTLETQSVAEHHQIRLLFQSFDRSDSYVRIEENINGQNHNNMNKLDCATNTNLNDLEIYGYERANYEGVNENIIKFFKEE